MISKTYKLNLTPGTGGMPPAVHVSQYDQDSRTIVFQLYDNSTPFTIPDGTEAYLEGTKPDGKGFYYKATADGAAVFTVITKQMTAVAGKVTCQVKLVKNGAILGSANFVLDVEPAALGDDTALSESEYPALYSMITSAEESAKTAATSATAAATSANTASSKATAAATSATAAATSEANASTAATNAAAAQTAAETAATNAAKDAEAANLCATQADQAAVNAISSEQTAKLSATAAATSATNAATSETNAKNSEISAANDANEAGVCVTEANQAASKAQTSATAAATSEANASAAATNAAAAQTAAEAAKTAAETAKTAAESAKSSAQTYKNNASTYATNAKTYATNASTSATNAATSEANAAASATAAAESAATLTDSVALVEETPAHELSTYPGVDLENKFSGEISSFASVWDWLKDRLTRKNLTGIHVKDYITVKTTRSDSFSFKACIAGINPYLNFADPEIAACHLDFISEELWPDTVKWNLINYNNGLNGNRTPFGASNVRAWINSTTATVPNSTSGDTTTVDYSKTGIYYYLPTALKNAISEKTLRLAYRYSSSGVLTNDNYSEYTTVGKLWLPSVPEIFGGNIMDALGWGIGEMVQYEIFRDTSTRVKFKSGLRYIWPSANACVGDSGNVYFVDSQGWPNGYLATLDYAVPVCFRIMGDS